jgi:hypothetical protein
MAPWRLASLVAVSVLLSSSGCNLVTGADDLVIDPALGTTSSAGQGGTSGGLPHGGTGGTGATGGTGGTGGSGACTGAMVPDFSLTDVNSTSATYNTNVSPRDYLHQISAWYFGNAL